MKQTASEVKREARRTFAKSREEWRLWLEKNHAVEKEILLVYYKKHTGKPSVSYLESVEEAICFGWIDGIKKRIDDETYSHKFTPRKKNSKWSPQNIKLARKMMEEGKMAEAGLAAFKRGEAYSKETLERLGAKEISLTPEIETALKQNPKAWENFNNLASGYRKQYTGWLVSAKRPETRERRLKEAITLLEQNKKLGMK